jgi:alpha-tubulin suppressor-like RCC1 family protein
MALTRTSLPGAARRILLLGTGLSLAGATAFAATGPAAAQDASGRTISHWGTLNAASSPTDQHLLPVALKLPRPVAEVGSSNSTQYALLTNGAVYAWGVGTQGQLGNGGTSNSFTKPVRVSFPAGVKISKIATGGSPGNSALAIDTTGHAWGWGLNADGEFCLGNKDMHLTPVKLPFSHVTTLAGGANHATYDAGGTLYSCGANKYGQLGDGLTISTMTPVKVIGLNDALVTTLVAAWGNAGALLSNGDYYDWGYNAAGQVGNGTTTSAATPFLVPLPAGVTVAAQGGSLASNGQTLVLLSNGSLYAWGNGMYYQLGNGATGNEESPVKISPPTGVTYTALASGGNTSYGISSSGDVWAWGNNSAGQVGDGTHIPAKQPVEVLIGATGISAAAGDVVVSTPAG